MADQTETWTLETMQYRGDASPAIPSFEIGVPVGWAIGTQADQLAVMVDPSSYPPFRVSVMVGADPVAGSLSLQGIVAYLGPTAGDGASAPASAAFSPMFGTIGGLTAAARLQPLVVVEPSLELAQLQVVLFAPNGSEQTKHLFSIHASCLATDLDGYLPLFTAVTRSLRFL